MLAKRIWWVSLSPKQKRVCAITLRFPSTVMNADMTYYVSFADKPVYLKELSETSTGTDNIPKSTRNAISSFFPESVTSGRFVVAENTDTDGDLITRYVESCLTLNKLKRSVDSSDYEIVLGARLDPDPVTKTRDRLKRCLFFSAKRTTSSFKNLPKVPKEVNMYEFVQIGSRNIFERKELHCDNVYEGGNKLKKYELITPDDTPSMFKTIDYSPVFHSFERTMDILQKVSDIQEVQELLVVKRQEIPDQFDTQQLQSEMKHSFVVVEGMDAAGKTTLTETLENKLQAVRYQTPPPCIQHLRRFFDSLPEIVRRAYYSLGNYIVSVQIAKECQKKPVIMDRFWHSTAAYGIMNETTLSDLPHKGHMTYNWPDDLLKPNCVLFLTVSEEVRKQRMNQRPGVMTLEEMALDRDALSRQRLCEAYKRMSNPECTEIDASGSKEQVVEMALAALLEHGVKLS